MFETDLNTSIDQLEQQLVACEEAVARVRRLQSEALDSLTYGRFIMSNGAPASTNGYAGDLYVSAHTARDLVDAALVKPPYQPALVTLSRTSCRSSGWSLHLAW